MKIHIGAYIIELPKLLREDDQIVFADAGLRHDDYKRGAPSGDTLMRQRQTQAEQKPVI